MEEGGVNFAFAVQFLEEEVDRLNLLDGVTKIQ